MKHFDRNVLVTNPNSSKSTSVEKAVLDLLISNDVPFTHIETQFAERELNIEDIYRQLKKCDKKSLRIVVASGDGVANQVASAILERNIETTTALGFLSFGSFNDNARENNRSGTNILDLLDDKTGQVIKSPLEMTIDDQHAMWGLQYITLGWTAFIAQLMSNPETRAGLTDDNLRYIKSLYLIAKQYTSKHDHLMPEFTLDEDKAVHGSNTDFIARNGTSMGRVFQGSGDFSKTFAANELHNWSDMKEVLSDLGFIATAGVNLILPECFKGELPGNLHTSGTLHFKEKGTILAQADGEVIACADPKTIAITKRNDRKLSILNTKKRQKSNRK